MSNNLLETHPPLSDAVTHRNSVTFFIAYIYQIQEDRNMLLNKPTVGSVRVGICRGLPFDHYSVNNTTYFIAETSSLFF